MPYLSHPSLRHVLSYIAPKLDQKTEREMREAATYLTDKEET
jgi:hypothetical protein